MPNVASASRPHDNQQSLHKVPLPRIDLPFRGSNDTKYPPASSAISGRQDPGGNDVKDAEIRQDKPRLTIRQLRQAAQQETLAKELAKISQTRRDDQLKTAAAPQKKKPSIFGGLFQVREPTQVALNQVAAQMIAQHGSTSATKVPNVRLEKMPEFVPKVNSKWNGIPESAKDKEKREKGRETPPERRRSFFNADAKSESDHGRPYSDSRNSSSATGSSFGAYGNSSGSQGASSRTRFYAQSVNSSGDLASQQRAENSNFSRSPTSQPAGDDLAVELAPAQRWLSSDGPEPRSRQLAQYPPRSSATNQASIVRPVSTKIPETRPDSSRPPKSSAADQPLISPTGSANRAESWESIDWRQAARSYTANSNRVFLAESASATRCYQDPPPPSPLPSEIPRSRRTDQPSLHSGLISPRPDVLDSLALRKKKSQTHVTDAFLAGEAQELILRDDSRGSSRTGLPPTPQESESRMQQDLEKRPDSSRDRLGLRASMLFTDNTPWRQETAEPVPPSLRLEQYTPNTKLRFHKSFGKLGK